MDEGREERSKRSMEGWDEKAMKEGRELAKEWMEEGSEEGKGMRNGQGRE